MANQGVRVREDGLNGTGGSVRLSARGRKQTQGHQQQVSEWPYGSVSICCQHVDKMYNFIIEELPGPVSDAVVVSSSVTMLACVAVGFILGASVSQLRGSHSSAGRVNSVARKGAKVMVLELETAPPRGLKVKACFKSKFWRRIEATVHRWTQAYLRKNGSFDRLLWQLAAIAIVVVTFGDNIQGAVLGSLTTAMMSFQAIGHISYACTKKSPGGGKLPPSWYTLLRMHDVVTNYMAAHHPVIVGSECTKESSPLANVALVALTLNTVWHIIKIQEDILMQNHAMNVLDASCQVLGVVVLMCLDHKHYVFIPIVIGCVVYFGLYRLDRVW